MLSLLLAACGGGGGGDNSSSGSGGTGGTGGTVFDTGTLQGRWTTAGSAAAAYTAIVVPAADNTATAWLLARDASHLWRLTAAANQTLAGRAFVLGEATSSDVAGTYSATPAATPASMTLSNVLAAPLALDRTDALSGMAAPADAAGSWKATAGATATTWTLSDAGAISGSSTTGCTYAGNAMTPTSVKVYTLDFTETCAGSSTVFSGIATLDADRARLTVVATSTGNATGAALFFARP